MSGQPSSRQLKAEPYTQWEAGVASPASACGPATMAALMEYWHTRMGRLFIPGASHFDSKAAHINYIYTHHGGTPWGMSVRSFAKGLRAYISHAAPRGKDSSRLLTVSVFNDISRYKAEIDASRPVALKFDKWFSLRWRGVMSMIIIGCLESVMRITLMAHVPWLSMIMGCGIRAAGIFPAGSGAFHIQRIRPSLQWWHLT